MKKQLLILGAAGFLLAGCASANIAANLRGIAAAIQAGERNLATLCQSFPTAAVAAETLTCIARANGTTQRIVARTIAAAQAICMGTSRPASVESAVAQIKNAAVAAANAEAAGCQP